MKKKIVMIGAALPLLFGILVLGCPQDEGPDQPKPSVEVLDRIEIRSLPEKEVYPVGTNAIDTTGLEVFAVYVNEDSKKERWVKINLAELIIDKPDMETKGLKKVLVEWKDQIAFFDVWVGTQPKSVTLVAPPAQKYYAVNDEIDCTGAVLKAVYNDGSEETIKDNDLRGRAHVIGKDDEGNAAWVDGEMSIAGPKYLTIDYMNAWADPIENGIIVFGSKVLRDLAAELAVSTSGTTAAAAITVKIPASVKAEELQMRYPDNVWDDIGGLYAVLGAGRDFYQPDRPGAATNDKYVHLDLSEVTWTGQDDNGNDIRIIPGSTLSAFMWRYPRTSLVKIVSLKMPKDVVEIRSSALRSLTGLTKMDLSGLSKLVIIGEAALRGGEYSEVDFTGCVSLKTIAREAFTGVRIRELDLSSCTSLYSIDDNAFDNCWRIEWIELPPSMFAFQNYSFDTMRELKYVRFRTEAPAVMITWRVFFGVVKTGGPAVHHVLSITNNTEGAWINSPMNNFLFFYPRTYTWTVNWGSDYLWGGTVDSLWSHIVSLPYSGDKNKVYGIDKNGVDIDKLRGDELLRYNDGLRGQASIKIDTSTVQSKYKGYKVKSGDWEVGTLGGEIELREPPASALIEANPENVKRIVGYQAWGNYYNYPGWETRGKSDWETSRGNKGALGIPVIWPDNIADGNPSPGYPKFLFLEMEVKDASGDFAGYLDRWGKCFYSRNIDNIVIEDVRVARWVYVDKDCVIFNYRVLTGTFVWLDLKKGWNLIEVVEPYSWNPANEAATMTAAGRHYLDIGQVFIRSSPGLIGNFQADTPTGRPDTHSPNGQRYLPINIPSGELPWVVRRTNTWRSLVDRPVPTDITVDPPLLVPDINAVDPAIRGGLGNADKSIREEFYPKGFDHKDGQFGYQTWWTLSRKHPWRINSEQ